MKIDFTVHPRTMVQDVELGVGRRESIGRVLLQPLT